MEIEEFASIADRLGQSSRLFHFEVRIGPVFFVLLRHKSDKLLGPDSRCDRGMHTLPETAISWRGCQRGGGETSAAGAGDACSGG